MDGNILSANIKMGCEIVKTLTSAFTQEGAQKLTFPSWFGVCFLKGMLSHLTVSGFIVCW